MEYKQGSLPPAAEYVAEVGERNALSEESTGLPIRSQALHERGSRYQGLKRRGPGY